ncbi:hypothetical protein K491DRAFT_683994 [Lophiostoma macrostomum CBS 122681]|uniref:Heterokaryon incompatibility domain-containing protein n=1 Tax=Lophiostoma macrostomum CBS 122681 TaxID=1314788 RepID=A0A6A6SQI4_9PLEO|nr:hypothetical protein K491DRAFT_683994 [Lophiostoma macrostomum CBS 122681]
MEHLPVPRNPYTEIKVPFLGQKYEDDGKDYATYPGRKGWTRNRLREEIQGFKIDSYLHGTRIDRAIEFLEDLGLKYENHITRSEDKSTLQVSVDFLKQLKVRTPPERLAGNTSQTKRPTDIRSLPRQYETETWADGTIQKIQKASSITLYQCKEYLESELSNAESTTGTRDSIVQIRKDIHYVHLLADFTCEKNQVHLDYRRVSKIARLEDAMKYGWAPWTIADPQDSELWKIHSAFAMIQAWLFFGMMHQYLKLIGIELEQNELVDSTGQYMTTAPLSTYTLRIRDRYTQKRPTWMRIRLLYGNLMMMTRYVTEKYGFLEEQSQDAKLFAADIWVSVKTVQDILHASMQHLNGVRVEGRETSDLYIMKTRFDDAGWCKHQTKEILTINGRQLQYYAYMLGPPEDFNHAGCSADCCTENNVHVDSYQMKHSSMYDNECRECENLQSRSSRYPPLHLPKSDASTFWGPDIDRISEILRNEGIPLILIRRSPSQGFELELCVEPFSDGLAFVAISHVWSNGRGNPKRNELPLCQLNYIGQKVMNVLEFRRPVAFWIDTLCVPLQSEVRGMAILSMRKVYKNAFATLVLDDTLESWKDSGSHVDRMVKLHISDWVKRLWTLQEGALAKKVFVQFGSGSPLELSAVCCVIEDLPKREDPDFAPTLALSMLWWYLRRRTLAIAWKHDIIRGEQTLEQKLIPSWSEELRDDFPMLDSPPGHEGKAGKMRLMFRTVANRTMILWRNLLQQTAAIAWKYDIIKREETLERNPELQARKMHLVLRAVANRSTTKASDEAICLATLLGVDLQKILRPVSQGQDKAVIRMQRLIEQHRHIPFDFLFWKFPRMKDYRFRWAPRSLLETNELKQAPVPELQLTRYATMTGDGLVYRGSGYIIEEGRPEAYPDAARTKDDYVFSYKIHPPKPCEICGKRWYGLLRTWEQLLEDLIRDAECKLGIIKYLPIEMLECLCDQQGISNQVMVAIVQLETYDKGTWFVKYLSPGSIQVVVRARNRPKRIEWHQIKSLDGSIEVQETDQNQRWCIR